MNVYKEIIKNNREDYTRYSQEHIKHCTFDRFYHKRYRVQLKSEVLLAKRRS